MYDLDDPFETAFSKSKPTSEHDLIYDTSSSVIVTLVTNLEIRKITQYKLQTTDGKNY